MLTKEEMTLIITFLMKTLQNDKELTTEESSMLKKIINKLSKEV